MLGQCGWVLSILGYLSVWYDVLIHIPVIYTHSNLHSSFELEPMGKHKRCTGFDASGLLSEVLTMLQFVVALLTDCSSQFD